jgi:hypothetical protein
MAQASIAPARTESASESSRPPPRLVLASEALREDLAPVEPGRRSCRWALGGISLALALLGLALHGSSGVLGGASGVTFAAAAASAGLAGAPVSYSLRAVSIGALGALLMLLGLEAQGPLAGLRLGSTFSLEASRLVALTVLPGALLFRAHYRAYPVARWVLGAALLATAPFLVNRCISAFAPGAAVLDRAAALLNGAVVLAGFFGFMGADTTAGGSVWAALVLGILCSDILTRGLTGEAHWLALGGAAIGTACATTLAALAVYHLLAARLCGDAQQNAKKKASLATLP